jgi:hypothetical protein
MKKKKTAVLLVLFIATLFFISSCKGTRIVHGKDCGCGAFGKVEQQTNRPQ